jgi:dihydroorotate dehydrogenase (fumarate)
MDLTTRYLGLVLRNPLIASASPLNAEVANIRRLEDAGAGAVVLPSLFEEEITADAVRRDALVAAPAESFAEALSYFPPSAEYRVGPDAYLELIRRAADAVDIPVIGSLNGITNGGWISHAELMQQAGATAIELNIYFIPANLSLSGSAVEQRYVDIVRSVRATVSIPLAVKLSPYFSSVGNMAIALEKAGADGLVLFNRFYQPDVDLARLETLTSLELSGPSEIRLPLLWLGILSGKINCSLAAATGVQTADEVVKYLLVGADAVMTTSALLRHDVDYIGKLVAGLTSWLEAREFGSVNEMRGIMEQRRLKDPQAFERANYIRILKGYNT